MKILLLSEYFPSSENADVTGGVEARCFNVAKRLALKNKVKVITSWQKGLKRHDMFANIEVYRVGKNNPYNAHSPVSSTFSRLDYAKEAVKQGIKFSDADVVDGYSFIPYLATYEIGKKLKKPSVITYHETWVGDWIRNKGLVTGLPGELWERRVLSKKYDKIISVSEFTKRKLISKGVSSERIAVIPNGVDINKFAKVKVKKAEKTICCISRLTPQKKVDDLINAVALVKKEIPTIKCRIIGKGPELENLKKLVQKLKIEKNIEFMGFVEKSDDVIKLLKSSNIFCLPSVLEGFGMVVIEAMASGVPYVCSDIAPLQEVTSSGKGGLLFKAEDYVELAAKIVKLLEDKKLYSQKIKEASVHVKKYDWNLITKEIEKTYEGLVK
jgi:glycosyltransferase involved in cell wall biosynthesis